MPNIFTARGRKELLRQSDTMAIELHNIVLDIAAEYPHHAATLTQGQIIMGQLAALAAEKGLPCPE